MYNSSVVKRVILESQRREFKAHNMLTAFGWADIQFFKVKDSVSFDENGKLFSS